MGALIAFVRWALVSAGGAVINWLIDLGVSSVKMFFGFGKDIAAEVLTNQYLSKIPEYWAALPPELRDALIRLGYRDGMFLIMSALTARYLTDIITWGKA